MAWPEKPKLPFTPTPKVGGYQALCPTCGPVGQEQKTQEAMRSIYKAHWAKVHAAEGKPPTPKL